MDSSDNATDPIPLTSTELSLSLFPSVHTIVFRRCNCAWCMNVFLSCPFVHVLDALVAQSSRHDMAFTCALRSAWADRMCSTISNGTIIRHSHLWRTRLAISACQVSPGRDPLLTLVSMLIIILTSPDIRRWWIAEANWKRAAVDAADATPGWLEGYIVESTNYPGMGVWNWESVSSQQNQSTWACSTRFYTRALR